MAAKTFQGKRSDGRGFARLQTHLPILDPLEKLLFRRAFLEEGEVLWLARQVGEFGEEMEMPFVIAGEEKEESVDWLAVEGAVFDRFFGEDDGDDVE